MKHFQALCIVALLANTVSVSASDKIEPTRGWKTLKNVNGWSIQYPADWKLDDTAGDRADMDSAIAISGPIKAETSGSQYGVISVEILRALPKYLNSPKEYVKYWYTDRKMGLSFSDEVSKKILGFSAEDMFVKDSDGTEMRWILFRKNNFLVKFLYSEITGRKNDPRSVWKSFFEKAISTFKFTHDETVK